MKHHLPISLSALGLAALLTACQPAGEQTAQGNDAGNAAAANGASRSIGAGLAEGEGHATLSRAVNEAGLGETLGSSTPYTLFAPMDEAFQRLPDGTVDNLLAPEQRGRLTSLLSYHIVPGTVTTEDLARAADNGGGRAELATVGGGNLSVVRSGGDLLVTDGGGNRARIVRPDQIRSNGVVHSIDAVLMPAE